MCKYLLISFVILFPFRSFAIFGTEMVPLMKLVAGQVLELERLSKIAGASSDQITALKTLNSGIDRTVNQIDAIQAIIDRSQGVDPTSIRSITELNDYLERLGSLKEYADQMMEIRIQAASVAIAQSAVQGDTAYKMGQEMIGTGSVLAQESRQASPGRATQIEAASSSAQMMAKGIELQTMSQLVQLQALSLDLQRSQIEKDLQQRRLSRSVFINSLKPAAKRKVQ